MITLTKKKTRSHRHPSSPPPSSWIMLLLTLSLLAPSHCIIDRLLKKPLQGISKNHAQEADLVLDNARAVSTSEELQKIILRAEELVKRLSELKADPELKVVLWKKNNEETWKALEKSVKEKVGKWKVSSEKEGYSVFIGGEETPERSQFREAVDNSVWGSTKLSVDWILARMKRGVKVVDTLLKEEDKNEGKKKKAMSSVEKEKLGKLREALKSNVKKVESGLKKRKEEREALRKKKEGEKKKEGGEKGEYEKEEASISKTEEEIEKAAREGALAVEIVEWKFDLLDKEVVVKQKEKKGKKGKEKGEKGEGKEPTEKEE